MTIIRLRRTVEGLVATAALALAGCGSGGGAPAPGPAESRFVSAPDCPSAAAMVAETASAPPDATHLRVQHIGDAGTAELAGEIANPVTWPAGELTGFHPAAGAAAQRGYRDIAPPDPASVFQLGCDGAGFLINTWQFGHRQPLVGEGPSASVARALSAPPAVFSHPGAVLALEARLDLRHVRTQSAHVDEGTAQLGFFYYMRDATSGTAIAHVVAVFDSRPPGVGGSAMESILSDGQVAFASSPLAAFNADGTPVRYVSAAAGSATMRHVAAWASRDTFRVQVSHAQFAALLARLREGPLPAISPRPEDYRLTLFGVLGEVFPGTGSEHNVAMGASVFDLRATGG